MGDRAKVRRASKKAHTNPFRVERLDDRITPATATWDGGGGTKNNWTEPLNWAGDVAPSPGDDLVFPSGPVAAAPVGTFGGTNVNDFPAGTTFSSINVGGTANAATNAYNLTGASVVLTGTGTAKGVTVDHAPFTGGGLFASDSVAIPLTFTTNAQSITTVQPSNRLVLTTGATITLGGVDLTFVGQSGATTTSITDNGIITGVGNVTVGLADSVSTVTGQIQFSPTGKNNYTGQTTLLSGTLLVQPLSITAVVIPGNLVVGDDNNFLGNATVTLVGDNGIADTSSVSLLSDGVLNVNGRTDIILNLNLGSQVGLGGSQVTGAFGGGGTLGINGDITAFPNPTKSQIDPIVNFSTSTAGTTHLVNVIPSTTVVNTIDPNLLFTNSVRGQADTVVTFTGGGKSELRGTSNAVPFVTVVASGEVDLNNLFAFTQGILPGDVFIGDGSGNPATVKLLQQNGFAATSVVTMKANSVLDLTNVATFLGETIAGLSGTDATATVLLGNDTLAIQPQVNQRFAGTVANYSGGKAGTGQILVQNGGGLNPAYQEFSGQITLTGASSTSFNTGGMEANGGILVIDSPSVVGGVTNGFLTNGTVSGIGSVDTLSVDFTGTLMPGTYPASTAGGKATAANFVPGTITTQDFTLNDGTLGIQINDADTFGKVVVTDTITNTNFFFTTLKVTLPTGFVPSGGQAFEILDLPPGVFLQSQNSFFFGFQDTNGNTLTEGSTFTAANSSVQFTISYRGGDGNDVVLYNTQAPSVVVTRDPLSDTSTTTGTATFLATFSGPVNPIGPTGIRVVTTGGVAYSTATAFRLSDTQYQIVVSGLSGNGTVAVSLPQGATISLGGTPTQPSTSPNNSNVVNVSVFVPPVPPPPPTPGGGPSLRAGGRILVGTDAGGGGQANVYQGQPVPAQNLVLPTPQFVGGVRVATGDFNRDGFRDYVFATGPGQVSFVQVLDGKTGATLFSVQPFEAAFTGGVNVSAGDMTGDGTPELVITPDEGGGPRVKVFDGNGFALIADFLGINDPKFRGGVRTAVGDLNGDKIGDLVVAAGFGGGPRVAVYNGAGVRGTFGPRPPQLTADFFAFEPDLRNGAYVAIVDVNGDGFGDLVAGGGPGGGPRVIVYSGKALLTGAVTPLSNFFAGDPNGRGGIRLAAGDYDGDGNPDLITGAGQGDGSEVRVYVPASIVSPDPIPEANFEAFPGFKGGVFVG